MTTNTEPPEAAASIVADGLDRWRRLGWPAPSAIVVSGSGLGGDLGSDAGRRAPLAELLPFPIHPVAGHPLELSLLEPLPGRFVLYQRGRLHAYQGFTPHQVVASIRIAARLGARVLVMSNAAGGLAPELVAGDLVLVRDHLNLTGRNPLCGPLPDSWGPRFPDLRDAYDPRLRALAREQGRRMGIELREAVYAGVLGPSYETPAEIAMLRELGGDVVGMSTVLEVIAARHLGLRSLCISLVANATGPQAAEALDHGDVVAMASAVLTKVARLLTAVIGAPSLLEESADGPSGTSG